MTEHLRALAPVPFADKPRPARIAEGSEPKLVWVAPAHLYVDTRYQREIGRRGAANIRHMIEHFDWAQFGVLTVVELRPGLLAIIDGQYRATAALMHPGVSRVPCWMIEADAAAQARTFIGINAAVTQMSSIQIFHAAVAAGIEDAAEADACAREAGVEVTRYPVPREQLKAGQTLAAATLRTMWKKHGHKVLGPALALLRLADSDGAGLVNANTIKALCDVLSGRHLSDALVEKLQALDLEKIEDAALLANLREGGGVARHLTDLITAELDKAGFSRKATAPKKARRGLGSY